MRESCLQLSKEQKLGILLRSNLIWLLLYLKNRLLMGGAGLSIASFAKVGVKSENEEEKVDASRIKFMIPIALPQKK